MSLHSQRKFNMPRKRTPDTFSAWDQDKMRKAMMQERIGKPKEETRGGRPSVWHEYEALLTKHDMLTHSDIATMRQGKPATRQQVGQADQLLRHYERCGLVERVKLPGNSIAWKLA